MKRIIDPGSEKPKMYNTKLKTGLKFSLFTWSIFLLTFFQFLFVTETFGQCEPNTIAFHGSEPIFNSACGNNSYQNINGSTPTGSGQTFQWEYSLNGGAWITISPTGEDLSKTNITNLILVPNGNASGNYRIRRIVNDDSPLCNNTSSPVFLYYSDNASEVSGGSITPVSTSSCSPAVGTLSLQDHTGPILRWEQSLDGGAWTNIVNTTSSYMYNLSVAGTYCFRALVDDVCSGSQGSVDVDDDYSVEACVTVVALPTVADAGTVDPICSTNIPPISVLSANTPTTGTGEWSVFSGPPGGTFGSTSSPTTIFTHNGAGVYVLRWTISNPPCTPSTSDVTLFVNAPTTIADAGTDQTQCMDGTFVLTGNTPTVGTGMWSIVSGSGSLSGTNPVTISGVTVNTSTTLRWTISNAPCNASTDDVIVTNTNQGPPTPGAITGTTPVCPNTSYVYNIMAVTGASSYTWSVPTGWSITNGQGTISITVTSGAIGQNGDITVVSNNSCNASSPSTYAVVVADNTPPDITCPMDVTISCASLVPIVDINAVTVSDNCSGSITVAHLSDVIMNQNCVNQYIINRTYRATDANGNTNDCIQVITVNDTENPVLSGCPSDVSVDCESVPVAASVTATDNCSSIPLGVVFSEVQTAGSCAGNYSLLRTWTATDECGNTSSCSQTITVSDTDGPVLSGCPSDVSVDCESVPLAASVTATDNCSSIPLGVVFSEVQTAGTCAGNYSLLRTWTATDECGNTSSCSQTITVSDTDGPVLSGCPSDVSVDCESVPVAATVTATDNCSSIPLGVVFSEVQTAGTCAGNYSLLRTWTATDECGNTSSCSQTITVSDTDGPVLSGCPSDVSVDCESVPLAASVTATDNCSSIPLGVVYSEVQTAGTCAGNYSLLRTWTATDECGNTSSCSQTITVSDTDGPVLSGCPSDVSVDCESVPVAATVTATDNCSSIPLGVVFSEVQTAGNCAGNYSLLRTWTATDECGNASSCSQTITVSDTDGPVLSGCPSDVSVDCESVPVAASVTATDNCSSIPLGVVYSEVQTAGTCAGNYSLLRTWTATDECGNTSSCSQTITVSDTDGPVLSGCPSDVSVDCESVPVAATVTATDNCSSIPLGVVFSEVQTAGTCAGNYSLLRTWTATDECGNTSSCSQTITVSDTDGPVLSGCPSDVSVDCESVPVAATVTATDNCSSIPLGVVFSEVQTAGNCAGNYSLLRTWTATDECGNTSSCSQTITVSDTDGPVISGCPSDISVDCESVPVAATVTATDNCSSIPLGVVYSEVQTAGNCAGNYSLLRTWTATDECGNTSSCSQTITVSDTDGPVISGCPSDISVDCESVPVAATVTATDNCSSIPLGVVYSEVQTAGNCAGNYSLLRTWTATDECGNTSSCSQTITVSDTDGPVLSGCLSDISVDCESVPLAASVTATDNCSSIPLGVVLTEVQTAGNCAGNYSLLRTWTATDECGNTSSCSQTITVSDTDGPVLTGCPSDVSVDCESVPTAATVTAADNCSSIPLGVEFTEVQTSGNCAGNYSLLRTWTATDECGNTSSCSQTITVSDTDGPVLTGCPSDVSVDCESVPAAATVTATDNCSSIPLGVVFSEIQTSGNCAGNYSLLRTWTATDECGNTSSCSQTITVSDTDGPVLTGCPSDVSVDCESVPAAASVTATDNCSSIPLGVVFSEVQTAGTCAGNYSLLRTWTATDECGNTSSCSQTITVSDTDGPVLSGCPSDVSVDCESVPLAASVTATDNCSSIPLGVVFSEVQTAGTCAGNYSLLRTWTATDECGNTSSCSQTITVSDTDGPVLSGCPSDISVDCESVPAAVSVTATDNCSSIPLGVVFSEVQTAGTCAGNYSLLRTWTATDECGNTSSCSQTITVSDTDGPVLNGCPSDVSVDCESVPVAATVTATDNCSSIPLGVVFSEVQTAGTCAGNYSLLRTWTATDECGNTSSCSQTITVSDTDGPVLSGCPSDVSVDCESVPVAATVTATDNCSSIPLGVVFSEVQTAGTCAGNYSLLRTWTATDECGNTSSCSQTITVSDTDGPVLSGCPSDVSVDCESVPVAATVTAADNCSSIPLGVVFSEVQTAGTCAGNYSLLRTWTATDECGNTSSCSQTITVSDTDGPVLSGCPSDVSVDCESVPVAATVTAADNCSSIPLGVVFSEVQTAGNCAGNYSLLRTWTATDECGNTSSCSQTITVSDTDGPVLSGCPSDISVDCESVPVAATVTATDNCSSIPLGVVYSEVQTTGNCAGNYSLLRTWTATDECGNTSSCSQTITVSDTDGPVLSGCPSDISVDCESVPVVATVTATDNCSSIPLGVVFIEVQTAGTCAGNYSLLRTWTATDECGNTSSCSQTITVSDTDGPVLSDCPSDISVDCESVPVAASVTATDNCSSIPLGVEFTEVQTSGNCAGNYSLLRTWTATDECGNTSSCSQTITVSDTDGPVLSGCPSDISVDCESVPAAATVTATDNCSSIPLGVEFTEVQTSGNCAGNYSLLRTWTATDECGNTSSCSQTITVSDTDGPVLSGCPSDISVDCESVPAAATVTATDNCSSIPLGVVFTEVQTSGNCAGNYSLLRTWTATDECGNTSSCSQTITVSDTGSPVLSGCPSDVSVDCESVPLAATVTATDNCSSIPLGVVYSEVQTSGNCAGNYSLLRTWTATDECGNTSSCSQTITVSDTDGPVLSGCPSDVSVDCESVPVAASVTATDNCSSIPLGVVFSEVQTSGTCAGNYSLLRTWTATDECGNTSSCSQTITVSDTDGPVLSGCPSDVSVDCESVPLAASVTATDNCSSIPLDVVFSEVQTSGNCAGNYSLLRTWTATDECGNTSSCSQTITVSDTDGPVLSGCPSDISVDCESVPTAAMVTATDNCSSIPLGVVFTEVQTSGNCAGNYSLLRTWTATDECGNTSSCSQTITVSDTDGPVLTGCPSDISVDCESVPVAATVTATDNCSSIPLGVVFTEVQTSGNCAGNYSLLRTWTATDECGNTSSCSQTITVSDTDGPVLTGCPSDISVDCESVPVAATVTATDNCSSIPLGVVFSEVQTAGTCAGNYSLLRTWTATDECGNISSCSQTITVSDTDGPVLTGCPSDISVDCESVPVAANVTATDNCSSIPLGVVYSEVQTSGSCAGNYSLLRTWTATDECGNTSSCSQTITVSDTDGPVITCPSDLILECVQGGDYITQINNWIATATVFDACDPNVSITTDYDGSSVPTPTSGLVITFMSIDACGNLGQCSAAVLLDQNGTASISCPVDLILECVEGTDYVSQINDWILTASATDACGLAVDVTTNYDGNSIPNLSCDLSNGLEITFTATDNSGNSQQCVATVFLNDTTVPNMDAEATNITLDCEVVDIATILNDWLADNGGASASDACGTITWSNNFNGLNDDCGNTGSAVVIFSVSDDCGNSTSTTGIFTIEDTTGPTFTCPADITIKCSQSIDPTETGSPTNLSDNCDPVVPTVNFSDSSLSGSCDQEFIITRTWIVADACGNISSCEQTIVVEDTTVPEITCPDDISLDVGESIDPSNTGMATAVDDCTDNLTISYIDVISDCVSNMITIVRTWTVIDECGNVSTCDQIIMQDCCIPPPCDITGPDIVCGLETGVVYSGPPGLSSYDWTITGGGIITSASNLQNVEVQVLDSGSFTLSLVVSSGVNCSSTCSETIDINSLPDCYINGPDELCEFASGQIYTAPPGMVSYLWTILGNGNIVGISTTQEVEMESTSAGTFILFLTITDSNGCVSKCNKLVTITSSPVCEITGPDELCEPSTINIYSAPPGMNTYSWSITGDGNITSPANLQDVVVDALTSGNFTLSLSISDGNDCQSTCSKTVLINEPPTIVVGDVLCAPDLLTYSVDFISNGVVVSASMGLVINNGGGSYSVVDIPSGMPVTITANLTDACAGSVIVDPPDCSCPPVDLPQSGGDQQICEGSPIPALTVSVGAGETADWYSVPVGGIPLATGTTSYTPSGAGTFYVETRVIVSNCISESRIPVSLIINSNPTAESISAEVCLGADISIDGIPLGGSGTYTTHLWDDLGIGSASGYVLNNTNSQTVTISTANATNGSVILRYTVTDDNGCEGSTIVTILINPIPPCIINGEDELCGLSQNNLYSGPVGVNDYSWSISGDGNIVGPASGQNVLVDAFSSGSFTLSLTVTDGNNCSTTCTKIVNINIPPSCIINGEDELCSLSQSITYSGPVGMNNYAWTISGDGNIVGSTGGQNVLVDAFSSGSFILSLTVTDENNCTSTCTKIVNINTPATCIINGDDQLCGLSESNTYSGPTGMSNYAWTISGDGNIVGSTGGQNVLVDAFSSGSFILTLIVTDENNCTATCTKVVNINTPPTCIINGDDQLCGLSESNTYSGPTGMSNYAWTISGDGSIVGSTGGQNVLVDASSGGSFMLSLTVTDENNCTTTCTKIVNINTSPTCIINGEDEVCGLVSDQIYSAPLGMNNYEWSIAGNGIITSVSNAESVTIQVGEMGSFTLSLTITDENNCTVTCTKTVDINPAPICNITGADELCEFAIGQVYSATPGMTSYAWSISGDGVISSASNMQSVEVDVAESGTFFLFLTIMDGNNCISKCSKTVVINASPVCEITGPNEFCELSAEQEYFAPSGMDTYSWAISGAASINGATNNQNVFVQSTGNGDFTLSLMVTDEHNCVSNCSKVVVINAIPELVINDVICAPDLQGYTVEFTTNSANISTTIGDVLNNGGGSYSITNLPDGVPVEITATNADGCTTTQIVTAPECDCPPMDSPISGGDVQICENEPIPSLTVLVGAGFTADWYDQASGGSLLAMGTTTYTPNGPGTFYVETHDPVSGCTSDVRIAVTLSINENPVAGLVTGESVVCIDNTILLNGNPSGGTGPFVYLWNITGGTGMATVLNNNDGTVSITGIAEGTVELSYTLNDSNGCSSDSATVFEVMVYANPTPVVSAIIDPSTCNGDSGGIIIENLVDGQSYIIDYTQNGVPMSFGPETAANGAVFISNLTAGIYDDFVVSNVTSNCASAVIAGGPFILEDPLAEVPTISLLDVQNPTLCNGTNGSITILGLTPGFLYDLTYTQDGSPVVLNNLIADINGNYTLADLASGIYDDFVFFNNANLCTTDTIFGSFILEDPELPTAPVLSTDTIMVCVGDDVQFDVVSPSSLPAGASISWTGPNGFDSSEFEPAISSVETIHAGSYEVEIEINNCVSLTTVVEVVVNETPSSPILNDSLTICNGEDLILNTTADCSTYLWIAPDSLPQNPTIITTVNEAIILASDDAYLAGSWSLICVNEVGCNSAQSNFQEVIINEVPPTPLILTSGPLCEGEDLQLETDTIAGATYSWTGPGFSSMEQNPIIPSVTVANSGVYNLVITINGCSSSVASEAVIVNALPEIPLVDEDIEICEGDNFILSVTNFDPNASYEWFHEGSGTSFGQGATLSIAEASSDTAEFFYVVVTLNGCTTEASTFVSVIQSLALAEPGLDYTTCVDTDSLFATDVEGLVTFWTVGGGGTAIIEFPDDPNTLVYNLQPGENIFIWTVLDTICNVESNDSLIIFYDPGPDAEDDFYEIDFNETLSNFDVLMNDIIEVTGYDLTILTFPQNGIVNLNDDGTYTYTPNPGFSGLDEFTYSICSQICPDACDTALVTITVGPDADCLIPNIITPNGDGLNDSFIVPCVLSYPGSTLVIFNRWGDEIYRDEDYKNDWEGTFEGKDLPVGSYYFVLKLNDEIRSTFTGFIYIQRN